MFGVQRGPQDRETKSRFPAIIPPISFHVYGSIDLARAT